MEMSLNIEEQRPDADSIVDSDECQPVTKRMRHDREHSGSNSRTNEEKKKLYFDYNATTPLEPSVIRMIERAMKNAWGNPSSLHESGKIAKAMINTSRSQVAEMLQACASDVVFTSGGTESNNMVFYSTVDYFTQFKSKQTSSPTAQRPHIITSNVEHDSIIKIAKSMEEKELIDLTVCEVDPKTGLLSADVIGALARDNTTLVSIMLANNETGIIQDISSIAKHLKELNVLRRVNLLPVILLHTDAAQAIGKIPVDVNALGVDYLTVVGHKFYGPRIGALWVKNLESEPAKLSPLLFGGGQERGFRPGTENTPMISGLGEAARLVTGNLIGYQKTMEMVRDYFEDELVRCLSGAVIFNGRYEGQSVRLPNTSNVSFVGNGLVGHLVLSECARVQASVGAACHSDVAMRPSRILIASGVAESVALHAIRISFGRETTLADVDVLIEDLIGAIARLRVNGKEATAE